MEVKFEKFDYLGRIQGNVFAEALPILSRHQECRSVPEIQSLLV